MVNGWGQKRFQSMVVAAGATIFSLLRVVACSIYIEKYTHDDYDDTPGDIVLMVLLAILYAMEMHLHIMLMFGVLVESYRTIRVWLISFLISTIVSCAMLTAIMFAFIAQIEMYFLNIITTVVSIIYLVVIRDYYAHLRLEGLTSRVGVSARFRVF